MKHIPVSIICVLCAVCAVCVGQQGKAVSKSKPDLTVNLYTIDQVSTNILKDIETTVEQLGSVDIVCSALAVSANASAVDIEQSVRKKTEGKSSLSIVLSSALKGQKPVYTSKDKTISILDINDLKPVDHKWRVQDVQFSRRLEKTCVQTLGQMLGLKKCQFIYCAMHEDKTEFTLDQKARNLCPQCNVAFSEAIQEWKKKAAEGKKE